MILLLCGLVTLAVVGAALLAVASSLDSIICAVLGMISVVIGCLGLIIYCALVMDYIGAEHKATTPSWSGEGLPPVGVVCEVEYDDGRQIWHEAEVIYHKKDGPRIAAAMLIGDGRDKLVWVSQFRPIRTPEQIAADEREAAVDAMVKACPYPGSTSTRLDCESLYSAGYRKP